MDKYPKNSIQFLGIQGFPIPSSEWDSRIHLDEQKWELDTRKGNMAGSENLHSQYRKYIDSFMVDFPLPFEFLGDNSLRFVAGRAMFLFAWQRRSRSRQPCSKTPAEVMTLC